MNTRRYWAVSCLAATGLGFTAVGCSDRDHTEVCVGPGCPSYDGVAGQNSFSNGGGSGVGGVAGIAGNAGTAGNAGDGAGGGDAGVDLPDGGPGEPECEVTFVTPTGVDAGSVTLGGGDDADSEPCGSVFTAAVSLSSNAATVNLFVNENPVGEQAVTAGSVAFNAELGNRGATPNTLRAEAVMVDGSTCSATFAGEVFVDCVGPSCSIDSPVATANGFLNSTHDANSVTPGVQTQVQVGTELEHVGQNVRLEIDDVFDVVPAAEITSGGAAGLATFPDFSLAEGLHTVRAECRDADGVVTLSSSVQWKVDVTSCVLTVDTFANDADPITSLNDLDADPSNELQVLLTGQVTGGDCDVIRVGECDGPAVDISLDAVAGDGSFSVPVTLINQTANLDVCAHVEDEAGNVSSPEVEIEANVRGTLPAVAFASLVDGARFNVAGTGGAIADAEPLSTGSCEANVVVDCTDVGQNVELLVGASVVDTEPCVTEGGLTPPFQGRATFNLVSLATENDGDTTTLTARQTIGDLPAASIVINVQADCEAPVLSISAPACGGQLGLESSDVNEDSPGLQLNVTALNGGIPDVTLNVTRGISSVQTQATGDATSTTFVAADLGGVGDVELSACASDAQDNIGCSAGCAVTISSEPVIAITAPLDGAVLSSATTDCDGVEEGLQVTVEGTTDAADDSVVQIALGFGSQQDATVASGAFSACVEALDGDAQVLTATVTDDATGLVGTTSIDVSVDTGAPDPILSPEFTVTPLTGRRGGTGTLTWESVTDTDGDALAAYRLRCATTEIDDEADWAAATDIPVATVPSPVAGTVESTNLTGIRTGTTQFCVVRGEDGAGQLGAVSAALNGTVENPFLTQRYAVVDDFNALAATILNVSLDPVGDVNGDGIADFIYGATNVGADLFFGTSALDPDVPETPDVQIRNTGAVGATLGFGAEVAGLGDISGDGRADFAVTARGANTVFVFFGRPSETPWPATLNLPAGACPADLCIVGSTAAATPLFGWDVHSANFDGVAPNDLVISGRSIQAHAPGSTAGVGRVFVLLGGTQLATSGTTISVTGAIGAGPNGFIIDPPAPAVGSVRTNFGISVASTTGSDGVDDLVIGANGGNAGATSGGVFYVAGRAYPAATTGLTALGAPGIVEIHTGGVANFASPVRAIGDFNKDTFRDFALGRNINAGGLVTVYLGLAEGGFSSTSTFLRQFPNDLFVSLVEDDNFSFFIAQGFHPAFGLLGDLDKDGTGELFVGTTTPDFGTRGSADLFYGSLNATSRDRSTRDFTFVPTNLQAVPNFVGDINNDTFMDMAVLDSGAGPNEIVLLY